MRKTLPCVLALVLAAGACGPAEVIVQMEIEVEDPTSGSMMQQPLSDIEVRLYPFDRDAVFDSLSRAYPTPEPAIPPELEAARAEVQAAQARHFPIGHDQLDPHTFRIV